jgi:hypothetical protein
LFYRVMKNFTWDDIKNMCGVVSESENIKIWDEAPLTGENRNFSPNLKTSPTAVKCCPNGGQWPAQLSSITPAPKGGNWRNWTYDLRGSVVFDWIFGTGTPTADQLDYGSRQFTYQMY